MSIEEDHPEWTDAQVSKKLETLRDQITLQIADVMAGKENAGKFFTCVDFVDDQGNQQGGLPVLFQRFARFCPEGGGKEHGYSSLDKKGGTPNTASLRADLITSGRRDSL